MNDRRIAWFDRLTDRELVGLLLANDEEAIEYVFFYRCEGMFAHIISSVLPSLVQKKEELISEFYLFLCEDNWRRMRQFGFRSGLNTWMTVVAVRFFNEKKSELLPKAETLSHLLVETTPDDYDIIHEMTKLELYEAIGRIPKQRERLALLGELTGKSAEMISKEMGCSVSAVYSLTKRAKAMLRKLMKGKEK
ncbi:MAG: sigma-70 family RNA polymerase sigma factor [Bacteroidales bacterium]|nr:sigma-70 family RNA polymerase sigma factor [Bacteroidales bacterium]